MTAPRRPRPLPVHVVLDVEYDGTPYVGWARQPSHRSVQGDLLAAFDRIGCDVAIMRCAGRTDAGVHASAQVVDVVYHGTVPVERLARALSGRLPVELKVRSARTAPPGFNARYDATSRAYEYRVLPTAVSSPLRARHVLHHPRLLDVDQLREAARMIRGQHRFTAFTPSRTSHTFFDRTIITSRWITREDELVYEVRGNAFLRHMVRILVGTMLEIGRGERSLDELAAALDGGARSSAGRTAEPHGLCFVDVTWDPIDGVSLPPLWRIDRLGDDPVDIG